MARTATTSPYFSSGTTISKPTSKTTRPTAMGKRTSPSQLTATSSPRLASFLAASPTQKITPFQTLVYTNLLLIPPGKVTSYALLARAIESSPRAVGGALRVNPFAPEVPCHRVIAADGYVGGFKGDWEKAPSGINQTMKLDLLEREGVQFTAEGKLIVDNDVWFNGPWETKLIE